MIERGDDSRFALEAFGEIFFRDFDGYDAVETRVAGFVDFAHASGAEGSQDFVGAETGSWCQWHSVTRENSQAEACATIVQLWIVRLLP